MPQRRLSAASVAPSPAPSPAPSAAGLRVVADVAEAAATTPTTRLELPPYDLAASIALERELGISHVLAQVLVRRGFGDPADARQFLDPRDAHDPYAFERIEHAVAVIRSHIARGSRITVHGDYDVDGVCSTAIVVRALRDLGANVGWFLPSRVEHGYGVSTTTVTRVARAGTELLVTVDCGITAVAEVAAARAGGLDVVISDHHAPRADGLLPECAIVHPTVSGYPCPDLCGAGVAFKLAQALGAATAEDDLELVALATIADLVPLRGENRRLVRAGLAALASTAKPGLRALMKVARADPSALDTHVIGFRLAPRMNAAGRLSSPEAGLELLLTGDHDRAAEIAAELDAVNAQRRAVEQQIVWEAESQVAELGTRSAFVLAGDGWHPGVIGIVASRVVERHHRPTILIALDGDMGTGSGRSIPGFDLLGALHRAAAHIDRYGGHRAAAGLTISRDRVDQLRAAIELHAERVLTPELLHPVERVDAVVSGPELGLAIAEELARVEPCGVGNPRPCLLVPGARFGDLRAMGDGRHARFSVSSGGTRVRAVAFGCEGRLAGASGEPLDATFRLECNAWNGAVEPRLVLRHAQPCAPQPIDVLGEPDPDDYLPAVLDELDTGTDPALDTGTDPALETSADPALGTSADSPPGTPPFPPDRREVLDRRGESSLAVLADAIAAAARVAVAVAGPDSVLAVCADVPRRLEGLSARVGGFSLISYYALERDPIIAERFSHVVALDPPSVPHAAHLLSAGRGFTHLAWGQAELRFAQQMHELEYGIRTSVAAFYRGLRERKMVVGEELECLLRGDGPHGRPPRLAARLIKVLAELELVSFDRDLPALAIAGTTQTALERSPAYRDYAKRYEDGRRYLSNPIPRRGG